MTNLSWPRLTIVLGATILLSPTVQARLNPRVEDQLAITHPRVVETLSQRRTGEGVGLAYYLDPTGKSKPNLSNLHLSELPSYRSLVDSVRKELDLYTRETNKPGDTVGVGVTFHHRLFDIRFMKDDRARFALVGVVNRMDKAFQDEKTCGEIRLIYRLSYRVQINGDANKTVSSRLPMTINLVLNAKSPSSPLTCQEIARRWKALNIEGLAVAQAADLIMGPEGVLSPELRDRGLLKQVEINLQLSRKAAAVRRDFGGHAVYLLKVLKLDSSTGLFNEAPLDNQVDRAKAKDFFRWLFEPGAKVERLKALDQGTIDIPERFLALRGYSIAPGGLSRAVNHVFSGTITDAEIATQLQGVQLSSMLNIKSVEGFKRRLTDVSCVGCHQTRAIGGFHFMGQDPSRWSEENSAFAPVYLGNSVTVPGSGHYFADLERRREVLESFVAGTRPNFATGFSSRPQERVANLRHDDRGSFNGWGAHCYTGHDPSFTAWTCGAGTRCQVLYDSASAPGMGVCVSQSGQQIGDPTEAGKVELRGGTWFADQYTRKQSFPMPTGKEYVNSPQSANPGEKTGGFPGGSIRLSSCDKAAMSRHPEARCGALPAASAGFNDCLFEKNVSFKECLDKYSKGVGLRGCSRENPCRDDYICVESMERNLEDAGVCVPPYFLFQFRVDGHPISF